MQRLGSSLFAFVLLGVMSTALAQSELDAAYEWVIEAQQVSISVTNIMTALTTTMPTDQRATMTRATLSSSLQLEITGAVEAMFSLRSRYNSVTDVLMTRLRTTRKTEDQAFLGAVNARMSQLNRAQGLLISLMGSGLTVEAVRSQQDLVSIYGELATIYQMFAFR